ncbi:MAG: choice-of-anchor D domain-containing protein [Ignavibacteriae bacterium]|nr:choice-of-anchor D domain-containing protein [Ignavibacteriota bacterium]
MKSFFKVLFTFLLASVLTFPIYAQTRDAKTEAILKKIKDADSVLNATAQGREFWLAVPLNDVKAQPTIQLEFYITSSYNTLVTLEVPGTGFIRSKKLRATEVVVFSTKDGSASYDFEIVTSQIADPRGIHIFADQAISVYMMNAKQVTADGYLALPINTWGTEYIHCSYYDFNEFRPLAAGFIVIASEDKTEVSIQLRGRGAGVAKTASGSKIGEVLNIVLNKGEVYNVKGDATTRGEFDLTGSRIVSTNNKPIGLISYHERTMLPVNNTDGRDHMCEMVPPVSAWGKKYVSIELQRDNKGDFYRVVASKANTKVKLRYYEKTTKELLGQRDIFLSKAGEFYEDYNTWTGNGAQIAFNGVTVWEADKPVLVMQYSFSANWDKGTVFDPFMIVVTPQEQYLKATVFQTPISPAFVNNYFSFIVVGDTADQEQKLLKSLVLDGDTVYKSYSQLLLQNIPGSNLYWGRRPVGQGAHVITSNTLFGGYIYGFGTFNSYGWPAALATKSLTDLDTLPPVLSRTEECGDFKYLATELRDYGPPPPDSVQIDQGIFEIYIVDSISYNYDLKLITAEKVIPLPKVKTFNFELLVKDRTKNAYAVLVVLDRAGNFTLDTVRYVVDKLTLDPAIVKFGKVRLGTSKQLTVTLSNPEDKAVVVTKIALKKSSVFKIDEINPSLPDTLDPLETLTIKLTYTPIKEGKSDEDTEIDIDSLIAETECGRFPFPVKGRGVIPCINVEPEWKAGSVVINSDTSFKEKQNGRGFLITNKGTDTLTITGVTGVRPPFFIKDQNPKFDIVILPDSSVYMTSIGFAPSTIAADSITVTFESNSGGVNCNATSLWYGEGKAPGPVITRYDWNRHRVGTLTPGIVNVYNLGTSPLTLSSLKLETQPDPNFSFDSATPVLPSLPTIMRPLQQGDAKVQVNVWFTPVVEGDLANLVIPGFDESTPELREGILTGYGFLPKIKPTGYTFENTPVKPCFEVGTQAPDGYVTIYNPSTSSELSVKKINFDAAASPNLGDFKWTNTNGADPAPFKVPMGETVKIPVSFTPGATGRRYAVVEIFSDAAPGPEEDPTVRDTVHVVGCGYINGSTAPGITVTPIDYGTEMACIHPTKTFRITNPGTADLVITGYDIVGNDPNAFLFAGFTPGLTLPPGESKDFDVQFLPTNNQSYNAQILVYCESTLDTVAFPLQTRTVNLTGIGKVIPVEFAVTSDVINGIVEAGKPHTFTISATKGEWLGSPGAEVRDFVAQVTFDEKHFKYVGARFDGAYASQGWSFNNIPGETGTGKNHTLTIDASGSVPIPANGGIIKVDFIVLLADTIHYPMGLNVETPKLKDCVIPTSIPTEVTLSGCFINARLVKTTGSTFALSSVSPNPATNNDISINYSVGLGGRTTFELYNSIGERVAVLMDEYLNPGSYVANVPISGIPSGVYSCRMISGPYTESQTITITR